MEAEFKRGMPIEVPYKPAVAVAAGEVVVVGAVPFVARLAIPANDVHGCLDARGGIYQCVADGNLAPGAKVYWNDTTNKITVTAAAGTRRHFGFIEPQSDPAADGDPVTVIHAPDGTSI